MCTAWRSSSMAIRPGHSRCAASGRATRAVRVWGTCTRRIAPPDRAASPRHAAEIEDRVNEFLARLLLSLRLAGDSNGFPAANVCGNRPAQFDRGFLALPRLVGQIAPQQILDVFAERSLL